MNPLIQPKTITSSLLITLTLLCFGLLARAQGVVPPPDGGYPNFTTAEGTKALQNLTTGSANTGVGWYSLFSTAAGSFNTATGAGALLFNTADANTAFGAAALLFNSTSTNNTAVGAAALLNNTIGEENTATGAFALSGNTDGDFNTANGAFALSSNTTGERNTATGDSALYNNISGSRNTAHGNAALVVNTTGDDNTAIGTRALQANNGDSNTAIGAAALPVNNIGHDNVATGKGALAANTTGNFNVAFGNGALGFNTTGSGNIVLGDGAGGGITTANEVICIGTSGNNVDNACYIGQIFGATSSSGVAVFVNSSGRLGTMTSSARFKDEIKPMDEASEALFALKPVAFRYKKEIDAAGTSQFGLVAEEVEKVNRDLVVRDKEGKPYSVRYDQVNAMLLNEFLKAHQTVQKLKSTSVKQEAMIASQQKQIERLTAGLQRVSAQLELNKLVPQMVENND